MVYCKRSEAQNPQSTERESRRLRRVCHCVGFALPACTTCAPADFTSPTTSGWSRSALLSARSSSPHLVPRCAASRQPRLPVLLKKSPARERRRWRRAVLPSYDLRDDVRLLFAQRTAVIQPHQIPNGASVELVVRPELGSALDLLINFRMPKDARDLYHNLQRDNMRSATSPTQGSDPRSGPRSGRKQGMCTHRLVVCGRCNLANKLAERVADVRQNLRHRTKAARVHPRAASERRPSPQHVYDCCTAAGMDIF